MPGISILRDGLINGANPIGNHEPDNERILSEALESVMHDDRYIQKILLKTENF
jgi:hypothetical protein